MDALATQLKSEVPALTNGEDEDLWKQVVLLLDSGKDLEVA